jgi:predicted ATPase
MFVLVLTGPPGAGKSDVLTALHDASARRGLATPWSNSTSWNGVTRHSAKRG